jgi:5-carboxymethyl-2-hydroxymuconate isomerase
MPHFIVEYTSNIKETARIAELLKKANGILIAQGGLFPTGGIRSRAIELTDYAIADGSADQAAFVHATLKIGFGRGEDEKRKVGNELFEMMKAHFASLFVSRYFALSMELSEFSEAGTWKQNNMHNLFKAARSDAAGTTPSGNVQADVRKMGAPS